MKIIQENITTRLRSKMKITNVVLALLFALFAYFQLNDPDPWAWVTLYGVVGLVCGLAAFEWRNHWVLKGLLGVIAIWAVTLIPDFIHWIQMGTPNIATEMKTEEPHIELTREFLGLLLAFLAIFYIHRQSTKSIK